MDFYYSEKPRRIFLCDQHWDIRSANSTPSINDLYSFDDFHGEFKDFISCKYKIKKSIAIGTSENGDILYEKGAYIYAFYPSDKLSVKLCKSSEINNKINSTTKSCADKELVGRWVNEKKQALLSISFEALDNGNLNKISETIFGEIKMECIQIGIGKIKEIETGTENAYQIHADTLEFPPFILKRLRS